MDTDSIRYQYGANYASLDDIQGATNNAQAMREEVSQVFAALQGVYEGDAAATLHQKQTQILQQMDAILNEITQTRTGGNQSQEDAAALDAHLAGGF
ncbi:hypothetical protein [Mycolicibacterium nivoides]|uniref:ESAT-6-like protein n=1 Tax=Mycolicibacterium nivoides TaxID=2487344 RepID=A0ABW9LHY5_9MYCO|nr:hypothetical protein [Mycolicibacterium nivoides]MBN3510977.1 hypothetical protein [Mycolicibacterium septicum]QRY46557.1 hypothetical protein JVX93_06860 [Mycolicibacterium boenickei]SER12791.1 hypothetical protein SAMN04488583_4392 [Mycobacterium sp. 88mf]SFF83625.1 hypothetical protein SAMN04488582_104272 [Mycobacterium sp. 455mf]